MKKYFIVILALFLVGCQTPAFYVYEKKPSNCIECNTCVVGLYPVNKSAKNYCAKNNSIEHNALVGCNDYNVGDILKLSDKKFTNK
jgi:hypothetical protein